MRTGEPIRQTSLPWAQNHELPCFEGKRSCILGGLLRFQVQRIQTVPAWCLKASGLRFRVWACWCRHSWKIVILGAWISGIAAERIMIVS